MDLDTESRAQMAVMMEAHSGQGCWRYTSNMVCSKNVNWKGCKEVNTYDTSHVWIDNLLP